MLIELSGISKKYDLGITTVKALDEVSLNIDCGEFVAILGQSGSGKSTLMNILGCLDLPTSGEYHLNGENVAGLNDSRLSEVRNKQIGFIFQGYNLIPTLNGIENVELPLIYRGVNKNKRRQLALDAINSVDMEARMFHTPNQLSGGQQQRIAIARAIAARPPIILADEPTGNLDSKTGTEVMNILKALNDEGKTIILITHDSKLAEYAKRKIRLKDGKIAEDSTL